MWGDDINDMTGIEDFYSIEKLIIFQNNIEKINLSQNILLEELEIYDNKISEIDLSKNIKLKKLNIANNNIQNLNISKNINLEILSVANNELESINLCTNANLTQISLQGNQLKNIDISKNIKLSEIYLADNLLTEIDVSSNENLSSMILRNNDLSIIDVSKNKFLEYLYLDDNPNLSCIKVNPDQLSSIPVNWIKTDESDYLIDCDKFGLTYVPDNGFETFLINLGIDDILDNYVSKDSIAKLVTISLVSDSIIVNNLIGQTLCRRVSQKSYRLFRN